MNQKFKEEEIRAKVGKEKNKLEDIEDRHENVPADEGKLAFKWQEMSWDITRSFSFPSKIPLPWLPQKKLVYRNNNRSVTKDCRLKIEKLSF